MTIDMQEAVNQLMATQRGPSLSDVFPSIREALERIETVEDRFGAVGDNVKDEILDSDDFANAVQNAVEEITRDEDFVSERDVERMLDRAGFAEQDEVENAQRDAEEALRAAERADELAQAALDDAHKVLGLKTFGQRLRWLLTGKF